MNKKFMNISQLLSQLGMGTKKECIKLIKNGKVKHGEKLVNDPNIDINLWEPQTFDIDGEIVPLEKEIYIALNKPEGYGSFFNFNI